MEKPVISTEWIICDSDAEWERIQTQPFLDTSEEVQAARLGMRRFRWSMVTAALLVLSITGVWLWYTAQSGLNQINAELNAALDQELWAVQQGKRSLATGSQESDLQSRIKHDHIVLQDAVAKSTGGAMVADLEIVQLRADHAVVRVSVQIEDEAFRQTRVYHRTLEGWQQVRPDSITLGAWRELETEHLSIGYFELDEAMVKEAAPRLDAFFAQASLDFGLAGAVKVGRYEIKITPDGAFADRDRLSTDLSLSNRAIHIMSPSFQFLPATASDADALFQAAALPLVYPMVQNALDRSGGLRGDAHDWKPLLSALRLWEFWQSNAPLANWKDEIVKMKMRGYIYPDEIPIPYGDICQAYRLWNLSPSSMSISLNCEFSSREPYQMPKMIDTLNGLLAPGSNRPTLDGIACYMPDGIACPGVYGVGLTTVLDYAVATYGRKQLPVLVGALGEHERWETLIPAVFGVSMDEFESGWQAYLAAQYDLHP